MNKSGRRNYKKRRMIAAIELFTVLATFSLISIGYSSWQVGENASGSTDVTIETGKYEENQIQYFSNLNSESGDALQYYYDSSSNIGGLVNENVIGGKGSATFRIGFNLSSFRNDFPSYSTITFTISLTSSYGLINSSTSFVPAIREKKGNITSAASTSLATTETDPVATEGSIVATYLYTIKSDVDSIHLVNTYTFSVEGYLTVAEGIANKTSTIFKLVANAKGS